MLSKFNIFSKVILLIAILLVPIVLLYVYSNQISVGVVRERISELNRNQLVYEAGQIDMFANQLSNITYVLNRDNEVRTYQEMYLQTPSMNLDIVKLSLEIENKLVLESATTAWKNQLSVYSPSLGKAITSDSVYHFSESFMMGHLSKQWQSIQEKRPNGRIQTLFLWYLVDPIAEFDSLNNAKLVFEARFDEGTVQDMLDQIKASGKHDPLFFKPGYASIYNRSADRLLLERLIDGLDKSRMGASGTQTVTLNGSKYLVHYAQAEKLGWYMVDYLPFAETIKPITSSRNLFFGSLALLLLMSLFSAFLLYSQVQVPIRELVKGVRSLKKGLFHVRMSHRPSNEFRFLFESFNDMAEQIQELIEKVYVEKIHAREASLKHLQSQINPHFLYNCLDYIVSMAELGERKAVVRMGHILGKYYRFITKDAKRLVTLDEELALVANYLEIQRMRMPRIEYRIEVPEAMRRLAVPRLIVQPVVENAVIHGIEEKLESGLIRITGQSFGDGYRLIVEDDGLGMGADKALELKHNLDRSMRNESESGLRNVHHRLILQFGEGSGLDPVPLPAGGMRFILHWNRNGSEEA